MNRYLLALCAVLGALLLWTRPAASQDAAGTDVTCATFLIENHGTSPGTMDKLKEKLGAAATAHASEVERWLEQRPGAVPVYRATVENSGGIDMTSEVVCVR